MTATAAGTWRAEGAEDSESLIDKAGVCDLVIFCFALAFSSLVSSMSYTSFSGMMADADDGEGGVDVMRSIDVRSSVV